MSKMEGSQIDPRLCPSNETAEAEFDSQAPDPFQRLLENFRLRDLRMFDDINYPPWSVKVGKSHGLYCYMVVGPSARLIVSPHIDVTLQPGDLAIVVEGASHELQSLNATEPTRILSSHQIYDHDLMRPLLRLLPHAMVNRGTNGHPPSNLDPIIQLYQIMGLPIKPGSMGVLMRLGELSFIQTAQAYIGQDVAFEQHRQMGRNLTQILPILEAMREDMRRRWTLSDICREAGISKTTLVDLFARSTDQTPAKYLLTLRMKEAAALLKEDVLSMSQIAHRVGYNSDGAFNRAFKRFFEKTPGAYRAT